MAPPEIPPFVTSGLRHHDARAWHVALGAHRSRLGVAGAQEDVARRAATRHGARLCLRGGDDEHPRHSKARTFRPDPEAFLTPGPDLSDISADPTPRPPERHHVPPRIDVEHPQLILR